MTEPIHLSRLLARRFLLSKHGLWPPRALSGKAGVLSVFERLACVQFDPLNVIARNPDLVLQSRVADYRSEMLHELAYVERKLYDYWDKMMSLVPIRDWPKLALQRSRWRERHAQRRANHSEYVETILAVIREQGPMSSLDFEVEHDVDWQTDWRWGKMRAAKVLLELLADGGELMVSHRRGARRYYDLAERVLPGEVAASTELLDEETFLRWRVARRCQGIGLLGPAMGGEVWAGIGKAPQRSVVIEALAASGEMTPVTIEGDGRVYHLLTRDLVHLEHARANASGSWAAFVAPLDNLLWSRNLVERLFDFWYVWEVYKPADQRKFGYYVLPVLYGDRFVARFDAKLDRENHALKILSWHWEPGESLTDDLAAALHEAFTHFLAFLGAERTVPAEGIEPDVVAVCA